MPSFGYKKVLYLFIELSFGYKKVFYLFIELFLFIYLIYLFMEDFYVYVPNKCLLKCFQYGLLLIFLLEQRSEKKRKHFLSVCIT